MNAVLFQVPCIEGVVSFLPRVYHSATQGVTQSGRHRRADPELAKLN